MSSDHSRVPANRGYAVLCRGSVGNRQKFDQNTSLGLCELVTNELACMDLFDVPSI
jgi:hypothetical protein